MDDKVKFLDELREFLESSNPNLGRKSAKREKFISEILEMVCNYVGGPETKQETTPKKKHVDAMKDRVLRMEPNEQIRKANKKGCAMMTEEASMQADKELGNSRDMTGGE